MWGRPCLALEPVRAFAFGQCVRAPTLGVVRPLVPAIRKGCPRVESSTAHRTLFSTRVTAAVHIELYYMVLVNRPSEAQNAACFSNILVLGGVLPSASPLPRSRVSLIKSRWATWPRLVHALPDLASSHACAARLGIVPCMRWQTWPRLMHALADLALVLACSVRGPSLARSLCRLPRSFCSAEVSLPRLAG